GASAAYPISSNDFRIPLEMADQTHDEIVNSRPLQRKNLAATAHHVMRTETCGGSGPPQHHFIRHCCFFSFASCLFSAASFAAFSCCTATILPVIASTLTSVTPLFDVAMSNE